MEVSWGLVYWIGNGSEEGVVGEVVFENMEFGGEGGGFGWVGVSGVLEFEDVGDVEGFVEFGVWWDGKVVYL